MARLRKFFNQERKLKMAHEVETMAWANKAPWHRLGVQVADTISADEMITKAGLNWEINKEPMMTLATKQQVKGSYALVRSSDDSILGTCGAGYKPVQPKEVLSFFHEFVEKGGMKMDTAGSLSQGKHIFALASIQEGFTLNNKDRVEGYLLFSSPNVVGKAMRILFTPVRVVCNNTLTMALNQASGTGEFRLHHAQKFDPDVAKAALGLASGQLSEFEQQAKFMATKEVTDESLRDYFMKLWPLAANNNDISRNAEDALTLFDKNPGSDLFPNTWWNAFNTVTFMVDHVVGRNDNNRLRNSWFGHGSRLKKAALQEAINFSRAA